MRVLDLLGTTLTALFIGPKGARSTLDASGLTAARTHTLPDKSGTVAMAADCATAAQGTEADNAMPIAGGIFTGPVQMPCGRNFGVALSRGAAVGAHVTIGGYLWKDTTGTDALIIENANAATIRLRINTVDVAFVDTAKFAPFTDNALTCGAAFNRWSVVYAATGTINTSDARDKTPVVPLNAAEIAAAKALASEVGTYQFLDAVQAKGADQARQHVGMTVQRAIEILQTQGLDPMRYGFICHDAWPEQQEVAQTIPAEPAIVDEEGNVLRPEQPEQTILMDPYRPAGDRYSFRPDELLLFIARGFDARLAALEDRA